MHRREPTSMQRVRRRYEVGAASIVETDELMVTSALPAISSRVYLQNVSSPQKWVLGDRTVQATHLGDRKKTDKFDKIGDSRRFFFALRPYPLVYD